MIDSLVEKMTEYLAKQDTQRVMQTRVLDPILNHVRNKFSWLIRLLQTMAFVITLQTCLLMFLVYKTTAFTKLHIAAPGH
jgi:hypothetical protein